MSTPPPAAESPSRAPESPSPAPESPSRWSLLNPVIAADPPQVVGYKIFVRLLRLVLVLLALLTIYAWISYPNYNEIQRLVQAANQSAAQGGIRQAPASGGEVDYTVTAVNPVEAREQARRAWLTNLKDLGQLFLLTPVFPLIGAVIGYIFGERRGREEEKGSQAV